MSLQLERLSGLGQWIYNNGLKYNLVNTTLTAVNVQPEPDVSYLLGDRYLDFSLCILFAFAFPVLRRVLTKLFFEVRSLSSLPCNRKRHIGQAWLGYSSSRVCFVAIHLLDSCSKAKEHT